MVYANLSVVGAWRVVVDAGGSVVYANLSVVRPNGSVVRLGRLVVEPDGSVVGVHRLVVGVGRLVVGDARAGPDGRAGWEPAPRSELLDAPVSDLVEVRIAVGYEPECVVQDVVERDRLVGRADAEA